MRRKIKLSNDTIIEVGGTPFASGGEADVFEILSPPNYSRQVLKIYKPDKRTKQKEEKLNFLINNKPNLIPLNDHHSVIWPIHLAYNSNKFVGYTMPKASGIKLELLCHPKLPKNLTKEWDKFSFHTPGAIEARLKLCFNISAALSQIHSFGSYVLVDMKPDNVMVKPDGLISIIDIDSTEIIKNNLLLFPAQVATPEYTPPEYYKTIIDIEKNVINETWDRFSIAIIFYRILFGIHPFTASLKSPFENLTNISDIIQRGFLPVGKTKDRFRIIPPPHNNFYKLDKNIQHLFLNALEQSSVNPNLRPTADDWCRMLSPNPGVQINRKLPSKSFPCLLPVYSKAVQLRSTPAVKIEKPSYLNIINSDGLVTKLVRLFKKSEKEKLYEQIQSIQSKVNDEYNTIENLKRLYELERNKSLNEIEALLKSEKSNIDKALNSYVVKANKIDAKANVLFQKEAEEYVYFENSFVNELNSIEIRIKEEYELTVNSFEYNHTRERERLLSNLSILNIKEVKQTKQLDAQLKNGLDDIKKKIQKLEKEFSDKIDNENKLKLQAIEVKRNHLRNKEKKLLTEALEKYQSTFTNSNLSQYKISDDKYSIFTDMYADPDRIASNLARNGISTAADIKGVDESGRILKSNGTWVKVSDVALTRAKKLDEWRKRKERLSPSATPPQSLPYSEELKVKNIVLNEFNKLDEEERLLKQQIIQSKKNIPNQISLQLQEAKKIESKITAEIQSKKLDLSNACKSERDQIQLKINDLTTNYNRLKLNQQQLFEEKTKVRKDKLEELKNSKIHFYSKTKNAFDSKHDELLKELRIIDDHFKVDSEKIRLITLGKMNDIKTKLESVFDGITIKIKDIIISFNNTVDLLITEQTKYKQMK
jgi:DNA-binding helix-hairpin-helix protein with protein kinase domain